MTIFSNNIRMELLKVRNDFEFMLNTNLIRNYFNFLIIVKSTALICIVYSLI